MISGVNLSNMQDLYNSRVRTRANKITKDFLHPEHNLFQLLPSGQRYRALYAETRRHKNSFSPHAMTERNS